MPRHARAVVGVEEDDGVVGESVFLELLEDRADLLVEQADAIVKAGQFAADDISVSG